MDTSGLINVPVVVCIKDVDGTILGVIKDYTEESLLLRGLTPEESEVIEKQRFLTSGDIYYLPTGAEFLVLNKNIIFITSGSKEDPSNVSS